MKEDKIRFKDLSQPLKLAIIYVWISITLFCLGFIAGFTGGLLGIY